MTTVLPHQRRRIRNDEAEKLHPPAIHLPLEEKTFWDAFLRYASIVQMTVLAALMAVYDVWPQTWHALVDAYLYSALSLIGLALLKMFRGHYSGRATAVLYSPLAVAQIISMSVVRDIFIHISGSYATKAYHDGPAFSYASVVLGLPLWAFWMFGMFRFYALSRAYNASENEIILRTPTAADKDLTFCTALAVGIVVGWPLAAVAFKESGVGEALVYGIVGAMLS
ncbi:hypothetical protein AAVH_39664, partial [Aphelenchoides avenae]